MPVNYSIEEMIGKQYGRWTVLGGLRKQSTRAKAANQTLCQCTCGIKRWVLVNGLRNGRSASCGCKSKEMHSRVVQSRGFMPKQFTTEEAA
jgi:hypothetical protein